MDISNLLTNSVTEYEIKLPELKKLFAEQLKVEPDEVIITSLTRYEYDNDPRMPGTSTYFDGLKIKVVRKNK